MTGGTIIIYFGDQIRQVPEYVIRGPEKRDVNASHTSKKKVIIILQVMSFYQNLQLGFRVQIHLKLTPPGQMMFDFALIRFLPNAQRRSSSDRFLNPIRQPTPSQC